MLIMNILEKNKLYFFYLYKCQIHIQFKVKKKKKVVLIIFLSITSIIFVCLLIIYFIDHKKTNLVLKKFSVFKNYFLEIKKKQDLEKNKEKIDEDLKKLTKKKIKENFNLLKQRYESFNKQYMNIKYDLYVERAFIKNFNEEERFFINIYNIYLYEFTEFKKNFLQFLQKELKINLPENIKYIKDILKVLKKKDIKINFKKIQEKYKITEEKTEDISNLNLYQKYSFTKFEHFSILLYQYQLKISKEKFSLITSNFIKYLEKNKNKYNEDIIYAKEKIETIKKKEIKQNFFSLESKYQEFINSIKSNKKSHENLEKNENKFQIGVINKNEKEEEEIEIEKKFLKFFNLQERFNINLYFFYIESSFKNIIKFYKNNIKKEEKNIKYIISNLLDLNYETMEKEFLLIKDTIIFQQKNKKGQKYSLSERENFIFEIYENFYEYLKKENLDIIIPDPIKIEELKFHEEDFKEEENNTKINEEDDFKINEEF